MKNIDVSICVFAYDKEKYIVKCLESILMQKTQFNTEIVIGEDYSTDKSSYFINGVLDKISKDFVADKRIVKIGRGLL